MTLVSALATTASAEFQMYDFEPEWQMEDWRVDDPETQSVSASNQFGTQGPTSVRLIAEPGSPEPGFDLRFWDNNFEPYDRVAFDLVNRSPVELRVRVGFVVDHENGYQFLVTLPPLSAKRVVEKLKLPKFVRHDNVHFMTFHVAEGEPADFHIDNFVALHKDDPAPDTETPLLPEAVANMRRDTQLAMIDEVRASSRSFATDLPAVHEMLTEWLNNMAEKATGPQQDKDAVALADDIWKAELTVERFKQVRNYLSDYSLTTDGGFLVGFSSPMVKLMPKHMPTTNLEMVSDWQLSLAGGETEAFQVAILPFQGDVKGATVTMSDLTGPDGETISGDNVDVDLMAYSKTEQKTEPNVDYVGWWPEPIIATDKPIDVALGDLQSWWVRITAPRDQKAGLYSGTLTVSAQGQDELTFPVYVEVYGFNVPKHAPIPTAITYVFADKDAPEGDFRTPESWEKHKFDHVDVLNDYYMGMDNIYRWADPNRLDAVDWELIDHQVKKGTLVAFNISHFHGADDKYIESVRPYYEEAKKRGLLDHAYIYGYDETPPYSWESINNAAKRISDEFPELLTMTTSQDHSYGLNSPIEHLGAWVPIISRYNPTLAKEANKLGRKVWWYTCIWPPRPYPNIFTDYPAVDNRVLTGLMHMKYKPDGFLYYHMSIWDQNPGIEDFPYTNWDPFAKHINANGDGSIFNIMADGTLVPTIRAENYRDGFEDLAYWMILQHQVRQYEEAGQSDDEAWLRQAKITLDKVNTYVRSREDWTESSEDIYNYRSELAKMIEASPIADTDPWKDGMGVRGIDWN